MLRTPRLSFILIMVTAALPVLCVLLNHWLSIRGGYIPDCIPYFEGCTSISSTGRHGVSYWLFKAMMLPQALLDATASIVALEGEIERIGDLLVFRADPTTLERLCACGG